LRQSVKRRLGGKGENRDVAPEEEVDDGKEDEVVLAEA